MVAAGGTVAATQRVYRLPTELALHAVANQYAYLVR